MPVPDLIIDVPIDLNFVWALAHAVDWCPYEDPHCSAFEDPFVRSIGLNLKAAGTIPNAGAARRLWTAQLRRTDGRGTGSTIANEFGFAIGRDRDLDVEQLVSGPGSAYAGFWYSHLGIRWALESWQERFVRLLDHGHPPYGEFQARSPLVRLSVVGIEDALRREDAWVIAGALAVRSPEHLQSLIG